MRLTKLSLVAALLVGSSAFAIENTKISGDARAYYGSQESDAAGAGDIFDKSQSYTNFAAHLDLTTDLTEGISAGIGYQVVTTLGVEHNIVNNVWSSAHTAQADGSSYGNNVESSSWVDEAWLAGTAYDTTLKIGRQALDTPLAFSETWGVDKNTFESITLINQSLPDTTIVVASIGKSNGSADNNSSNNVSGAAAGYVGGEGKFETFGTDGTYAYGIINNSIENLTAQVWYYDMVHLAQAYWFQADYKMGDLSFGAQYASAEADAISRKDTNGYSAKIGYEMKDVVTLNFAYSDIDDGGYLGLANTATGSFATIGGQSKLYTEMWWNYGVVSAVGSESFALSAESNMMDIDWFLGLYTSEVGAASVAAANTLRGFTTKDLTEITLTASKSFGPLDTSLAIIAAENDTDNNRKIQTTDVQVYLTYNF